MAQRHPFPCLLLASTGCPLLLFSFMKVELFVNLPGLFCTTEMLAHSLPWRWSPEQCQWWWQWRGNEGKSHPNLEVLLSLAEIQIQRYRVQVYRVIDMEVGKALSWGHNPQLLELIHITSSQQLRQRGAVGGRPTGAKRESRTTERHFVTQNKKAVPQ